MKKANLGIGEYFFVEDNLSSGDRVDKYYECVLFDGIDKCSHCSLGMTSPICSLLECEGSRRKDNRSVVFVERDNSEEIANRCIPGIKLYDGKRKKQGDMNEEYEHGDYNEVPQRDKEVEDWLNYKKCAAPVQNRMFDIEKAVQGCSLSTRGGYSARLVATNVKGEYPLLALVDGGERELPILYTREGKICNDSAVTSNYDLVTKEKRYINVYSRGKKFFCSSKGTTSIHDSSMEIERILNSVKDSTHIATIQLYL